MPTGYHKKPLGAWPDDEKHQAVQTPEEEGEQSKEGHMPDPEDVEDETVLDSAKKMGLYKESDEEHQEEVNLAEEEKEDIEEESQT